MTTRSARSRCSQKLPLLLLLAATVLPGAALAQAEGSCIVSVLNQTAHVGSDGSWNVPNVPANMGPVRARITCVRGGEAIGGASSFFDVVANRMSAIPAFDLGVPAPSPARLALSGAPQLLSGAGETLQLAATATLSDGSTADVTVGSTGTTYSSTNAAIAAVDGAGRVTARGSGRALIGALHEAIAATFEVEVRLSGDSDGDGIPDDWETANGLDPRDDLDALEDPDRDGLSSLQEFQRGLQPFNPDSDGDGLLDGREVGALGTDPLRGDTDGDGLWDGLEIETGSDPLDAASFNLAAAMTSIEATPAAFTLVFNTVYAEASRKLGLVGRLRDGRTIDLAEARYGASLATSDLEVVSFGPERGRVYAGREGQATVTVSAGGHSAPVNVRVATFSPQPLSFVPIPGFANAVDVAGSHAFVAAGAAGLQVVDVSDLLAPRIVAALDTPGNANDLRLGGDFAYVADGSGGLAIVDVSNPEAPRLAAQLAGLPGASDLAVAEGRVYVADAAGLAVIDVQDPEHPLLLGSVPIPGTPRGVDVSGRVALVAAGEAGLFVVDVSNPAAPVVVGATATRPDGSSRAADVVARGTYAYVADGADFVLGGMRIVDFSAPGNPVVVGTSSDLFGLRSLALVGPLALAADYYYANAVPIFSGVPPVAGVRGLLDFSALRDDEGHGVVGRDGVAFLVGTQCCGGVEHDGATGDGALFIGRYAVDAAGDDTTSPHTEWIVPQEGEGVGERTDLDLSVRAFDDGVVESVEFFVDGTSLGSVYAPNFTTRYRVPGVPGVPGIPEGSGAELVLGARARDLAGNVGPLAERRVAVVPNTRPTVRLLSPLPGQRVPEGRTVVLAADASDDQAVRRVQFFVEGALVATDTAPPYRFEMTAPSDRSALVVTALAFDDVGASDVAGPVTVGIDPDAAPTVRIIAPAGGAEAEEGTNLEVLAGATDDLGLQRVTLFVDDLIFESFSAPPYRSIVPAPAAGSILRLAAEAEDTKHQVVRSPEVQVVSTSGPKAAIHGRIVNPSGAPVPGARVEAVGRAAATTSESDGTFLLADLAVAGGPVGVEASGFVAGSLTPYRGALAQPLELAQGTTVEVGDLEIRPVEGATTSVTGVTVDFDLVPIAGARVKVYSAYTFTTLTSGPDGGFRLDGVPVDGHGVQGFASAPGSGGVTLRGRSSATPNPGGTSDLGLLVLGAWDPPAGDPHTAAAGRVVSGGAPVAGVRVFVATRIDLYEAISGSDGRFLAAGIETIDGDDIAAFAAAVVNGQVVTGETFSFAPEPGGVTDLGDLELAVDEGGEAIAAPAAPP